MRRIGGFALLVIACVAVAAQAQTGMGHGRGMRHGPAGAALNPPPADLAFASRRPMATDAYFYWTIAEGGAPVGSAMPPFKGVLAADEIWQLIAHLRRL
jgi:hypothetical protein